MENTEKNKQTVIQDQGVSIVNNLLNRSSKETVDLLKAAIDSGDVDPVYVGVVLKKFAKVAELVHKGVKYPELKEQIETETKSYQEGTTKTFTLYGAKITIANSGFWNYSLTEDSYYHKLKEIEKEVKELIKNREEQLKLQVAAWEQKNKPGDIVEFGLKPFTVTWDELPKLTWEEGYGEAHTMPPTKKGKETLRYTL